MKIIKARWKPVKNYDGILHGELVYKGSLELLVDKIPEIKFRKIGSYLYGENEGFVKCYQHELGSTDGFAGRTIKINFEDGATKEYKGSLWDPYHIPPSIPEHRHISITTDFKIWEKGFTFYAGKITKELFEKIIENIGTDKQEIELKK